MATSKTNEFEEYVMGLLECRCCSESINSGPIHQCTNGHVVCKSCITKLVNCPICRNKSKLARNLIFEQIVENIGAMQLTNEGPSEKPKHQKWGQGQGSVGVSFASNEPKKEPSVKLNLQLNSDTIESAEHGVSKFEEIIQNLLICPICIESIKSAPIHQCTNGHVVCKDCITKLGKCPICRNNSKLARNLIFEQIIEKFTTLKFAIEGPCEKPKIQKWGLGSVRVFLLAFYLGMRPTEELSVIKQAAIWFYRSFLIILFIPAFATLLCLLLGVFLCIIIVTIFLLLSCYNLLLTILAQVGVDTPEEYYSQFGFNAAHIEIFTGSKG